MDNFEEIIKIQQMMSQKLMKEGKVDEKIKILDIINEMSRGSNKQIQVERIAIEAKLRGILETEITNILEELRKDGLIKRVGEGYIQRT